MGSLIDWYNIQVNFSATFHLRCSTTQYYNQGSEYTTCDTIVTSSSKFPGTAVLELSTAGISADKIVITKPAIGGDTGSGYIDPSTIASCVQQAAGSDWSRSIFIFMKKRFN